MNRLHRKLFWGAQAGSHKSMLRSALRLGKPPGGLYLLALPSEDSRYLLDILPAEELYGRKRVRRDRVVVGLAEGKEEAIELSRVIVDRVYKKTGSLNLRGYFA